MNEQHSEYVGEGTVRKAGFFFVRGWLGASLIVALFMLVIFGFTVMDKVFSDSGMSPINIFQNMQVLKDQLHKN